MTTWRAVETSVFSLVSVLHGEGLGEPHTVFAGGERYVSHRFAAAAERALREELAEDYREVVDLLTVVQRATHEYYGWVAGADDHAVLVASLGRQAVSLVRSGESVRFERCAADGMAAALVSRLPDVPAARGDAIVVRHHDFHSPRPAGNLLRRSTPTPPPARRLDALLDARRVSVAKLYAAERDERGVRQRSRRWLTLLDLVDGRWALSVTRARREKWITAEPGTPQVVAERLEELARSVR